MLHEMSLLCYDSPTLTPLTSPDPYPLPFPLRQDSKSEEEDTSKSLLPARTPKKTPTAAAAAITPEPDELVAAIYSSPPDKVDLKRWVQDIQETERDGEQVRDTIASKFPKLWKLSGEFMKQWLDLQWEVVVNYKNKTDFKAKLVNHILVKRKPFHKSNVPHIEVHAALPNQDQLYWYCMFEFMRASEERFKVDKAQKLKWKNHK